MNISFAPLSFDAVRYLSDHTGVDFSYGTFTPPKWFCASARNDDGYLVGVLACEFKTGFDVHFNTAITDPRCMSRRLLKAIFTALFSKARRITAEIDVDNHRALKQMQRMGFVHEGYCRLGINGVRDAYTFGMLREDCRFLPGHVTDRPTIVMEMPHGQRARYS